MARGARACCARRAGPLSQVVDGLTSIGATTLGRDQRARAASPFNVDIGPHRRYTFLDADLGQFKAIKDSLGGTLNDVVLAVGEPRARALSASRRASTPTGSC